VNVLAVNYGSAGGCLYPRPLKFVSVCELVSEIAD
jgi:hypothetical protein